MPSSTPLGELVPVGGGDPIPLVKDRLTFGRRPSCDVRLDFPNVSGIHCEFVFENGFWSVIDLKSSNGVKVKGERITRKVLQPGDELAIATHRFTIQYKVQNTSGLHAALAAEEEDIFAESLLKKAGLEKPDEDTQRLRSRPRG